MEKVVTGNLRKPTVDIYDYEYIENGPKTSLEKKMDFLMDELTKLEAELVFHTERFLDTKNEYGTNVITGISSTVFIPSLDCKDNYTFRIISGERGRDNKEQIDESTMFDIASVTKMFTLITLLKLADLGYVSLDEKICDINPDFQGLEDFTLNDLMRMHGKYWTDGNIAKTENKEEAWKILKTLHLTDNTREENTYNDFGALVIADTLAKRMSKITGKNMTYDEVLKTYILDPLGMKNTTYNPHTNNVSGNGLGIPTVHDLKARNLGGVCGHAGLFTNSKDLCILAEDMFKANINKGKVFNKNIVKKLGEITFPYGKNCAKGNLGMYLKCKDGLKKSYVPNSLSKGSFASEGWTGSLVVFDPSSMIHQNVLVNAIYPIDIKDEVKNNKPVFYQKALREYQEKTTPILQKMRYVKYELDSCRRLLGLEIEEPRIR